MGGVSWPLLPPSRRLSPRPRPAGSCGRWWTWRRGPEGGAASPLYSWGNLSWRPGDENGGGEREEWRVWRNEGREGKARDDLSYQTGIKASRRETYQAARREAALSKCWRSAVCERVCVCAVRHTGRSWAHSSALREFLWANSSDLAPTVFPANKGQLRHLLFWAASLRCARHAGVEAEHRSGAGTLQFHTWTTRSWKSACGPSRSHEQTLARLNFSAVFCDRVWRILAHADAAFPSCPLRSPGATELNYYNGDEWEAGGQRGRGGVGCHSNQNINSTPPSPLLRLQIHTFEDRADTNHSPGYSSDFSLMMFSHSSTPLMCFCPLLALMNLLKTHLCSSKLQFSRFSHENKNPFPSWNGAHQTSACFLFSF